MPGVPRATYMPYPFQIVQTPKYVLMAYEYAGANRTIFMDKAPPTAGRQLDGTLGRPLGGRYAGRRRDRPERRDLVRPGREFPQRRAARGRALHAAEPPTRSPTRRRSKTRRCFRGPGRSACRFTGGWKRTPSSWNSSAWSSWKSSCTGIFASNPASEKEVRMSHRFLTSASIPTLIAAALLAPVPVAAQPAPPRRQARRKPGRRRERRTASRTCKGCGITAPSPRWSGRSRSEPRRSSPTRRPRNTSSRKMAARIAT